MAPKTEDRCFVLLIFRDGVNEHRLGMLVFQVAVKPSFVALEDLPT